MAFSIRHIRRIDPALTFLILFVFVINLPYLNPKFMVAHDTKNVYLTFHYFFNHLTGYGELPRWLPYGEYGYNALFYQISNLSPFSYLAGLVGWIAGVKDTLLLFKFSVIGEQFAFLLGLHLLGRRLYRHRCTSFIVALLGVGSVIWYWQIYWDLRLYYLLPLSLYFYHRFIEEKDSSAFWTGSLVLMISLVGGLAYWVPVYAYLFLVMALIVAPGSLRVLRSLFKPRLRDLSLILILLATSLSLGYVLSTCLQGLHNYSPGRSMNEMRTELATFLTYTPPGNWLLHSFLDGTRPNTLAYSNSEPMTLLKDQVPPDDLTLYVGLLPVLGFIVALVRVRSRWFYCITAGLAAIVALGGSGLFSWLLYEVMPGMNMFRHLGLLLEMGKVLLLLAGGFGIDFLLEKVRNREWLVKRLTGFNLWALLLALLFILDMIVSITVHKPDSWTPENEINRLIPSGGEWLVLRLTLWAAVLWILYFLPRKIKLRQNIYFRGVLVLISFACVVDIAALQGYYWANRTTGEYAGSLALEPLQFKPTRTSYPSADVLEKDSIIKSSPRGIFHGYYANILQYDPCMPYGWVDIFPQGVHELLSARGIAPTQQTVGATLFDPNDTALKTVLACGSPKLRLVPGAAFSGSDEELRELVMDNPALDQIAVMRGNPQQNTPPAWNDPYPMTYGVIAFDANHLDMDIDVKPGKAGWLVYSDSFSPFWKAYVNGRETPVLEAYMAFKAIRLEEGRQAVSFVFENALQKNAMSWLMLMSISLAFLTFIGLGWQVVKVKKPEMQSVSDERDRDENQ